MAYAQGGGEVAQRAGRRFRKPQLSGRSICVALLAKNSMYFGSSSAKISGPAPHVRTHEFIRRSRLVAKLELRLAEAQVNERIAESLRAVHACRERRVRSLEIPAQHVRITDARQQPCCLRPLRFRLRKHCPGKIEKLHRAKVILSIHAFVSLFGEGVDVFFPTHGGLLPIRSRTSWREQRCKADWERPARLARTRPRPRHHPHGHSATNAI